MKHEHAMTIERLCGDVNTGRAPRMETISDAIGAIKELSEWQKKSDECVDRLEVLIAGLMAMTEPLPSPILDEMNRALDALIVYRGNAGGATDE